MTYTLVTPKRPGSRRHAAVLESQDARTVCGRKWTGWLVGQPDDEIDCEECRVVLGKRMP